MVGGNKSFTAMQQCVYCISLVASAKCLSDSMRRLWKDRAETLDLQGDFSFDQAGIEVGIHSIDPRLDN
ncbi:hypothetical protein ASD54_09125 [Rhizobium sp. Root149]|jgi:hypothetical protein|nr:hypothetical protein ASD54_09125 [Rhizobium sp. Root149]